jgi:PAS domain S-box-containing protein
VNTCHFMLKQRNRVLLYGMIAAMAAGIAWMDCYGPHGAQVWVLYCLPLLLSVYGHRFSPFLLAALFSGMTLWGYYATPPATGTDWSLLDPLIGIGAIGVVAILVANHRRTLNRMQQQDRIIEQSPVSIVITDRQGNITYVNPKFCEVTGYTSAEALGQNPRVLKSSERTSAEYQQLWKTILAGQEWRGEFHNRKKNGELYWESALISPLHDHTGNITHFLAIKEDITRERKIQNALHRSEAMYHSLVENMPAGVFRKNRAGRYVYVNPQFCQIQGLDKADILGKTAGELNDLLANQDAADSARLKAHRQQMRQGASHHERIVSTGESLTVQEAYPQPDGSVAHFYAVKSPLRDEASQIIGTQGVMFNISDLKRTEAALQESEARYRAFVETSPDGFWVLDEQGHLLEVNEAYTRRSGYTREELLAMRVSDLEVCERPTEAAAHILRIVREGSDIYETLHRAKDGSIWQVEVDASYWPQSNGRIFVSIRDIGRRKRADVMLRKRLQLSELAIHGSVDQLIQSALDTAEQFTGSFIGFFHFVDPDQKNLTLQTWSTNTLQKMCTAEGKGRHYPIEQAGVWVECFHTKAPIIHNDYAALPNKKGLPPGHAPILRQMVVPIVQNDGVAAIMGVGNKTADYTQEDVAILEEIAALVVDVVGRQRAEEARRLAEEQIRRLIRQNETILNSAGEGIIGLDEQGRHIFINPAAARMLGYEVAELLGSRSHPIWHHAKPDGQPFPEGESSIYATLRDGKVRRQSGELFWRKDGTSFPVEYVSTPILEEGQVHGTVLVFTDITEKKKQESQVLRSQRMESIGKLASGIAHDLNNALAPIQLCIEVLRDKIKDVESMEHFELLEAGVQRSADLVKQVLTFGRGIVGERSQIKPAALVGEISRLVHETFPKSVDYARYVAPDIWPVNGDATQLHQVLLNLCINARDAMPKGGKLFLRVSNTVLDDKCSDLHPDAKPGPCVVIEVTDTGVGIPLEIQDRIFEPFFTTKEFGKGSGLGLSTTLGIIRSHGGFIHCRSKSGAGTTFRVYLPADATPLAEESVSAAPFMPAALSIGHGEVVLVVDDEENIRKVAKKALERFGYHVLLAGDGAEALKLYEVHQKEIAVVITDMSMPVMDGPTTIRELVARNPRIRIIGSSGDEAEEDMAAATALGVRHFISKPYTTEAILRVLEEVIGEDAPE